MKNVIKNQKLNFSSAKREYRDKNVFLKGDRALSKLITLLISNKKEFNHYFKSRSSEIFLLKLGNLHQNAKRYEARDKNVPAKRADFLFEKLKKIIYIIQELRFFLILLKK